MPPWYEYDAHVLVILAIAALAILACVVLVSLGKGGELTEFPPDVPPLNLPEAGQLTAVDFMALQLPVGLVGYHTQSVDETLRRAANAISARDTRIAVLEQRVTELLSSRLHARQEVYAAPGDGPRTEHEPPTLARDLPERGDPLPPPDSSPPPAPEPSASEHEPVTWPEPGLAGDARDGHDEARDEPAEDDRPGGDGPEGDRPEGNDRPEGDRLDGDQRPGGPGADGTPDDGTPDDRVPDDRVPDDRAADGGEPVRASRGEGGDGDR